MPKKRWDDKLLDHHNNYVEHLWNRDYFVNRLSLEKISWWRWVSQHNKLSGAIGVVCSLTMLASVIHACGINAADHQRDIWKELLDFNLMSTIQAWVFLILFGALFMVSVKLFYQPGVTVLQNKDSKPGKSKKHLPRIQKDNRG